MAFFSSEKSKLKMEILTKHGFENYRWWSPINQNKWNNDRIIKDMLRRFKKNELYKITNTLQFYENGILIYVERISKPFADWINKAINEKSQFTKNRDQGN